MGEKRRTKPRLTFTSSWGYAIQDGTSQTSAIEMLEGFVSETLYFGNPPYTLTILEVPADDPIPTPPLAAPHAREDR